LHRKMLEGVYDAPASLKGLLSNELKICPAVKS
jgi:hypothetical protein